ncbi:hypothetical protein M430DRAFT_194164 [Amorphotheca resinae ATCC 22711]|uniref:Uncharacterized protein n=1 Tax=Amorphotheca resinae ATCC 22711 TaxID=857342 RepID=A0A2T3AQA5_AMORE|nr:hypothetical protein M430DRAFT_194164 [Amorphotheca resinae ATCC 22711]PSS07187.1 hypothetical protein M430DRAFT_194164 [Amorphotheca resinae ATCC 22711]
MGNSMPLRISRLGLPNIPWVGTFALCSAANGQPSNTLSLSNLAILPPRIIAMSQMSCPPSPERGAELPSRGVRARRPVLFIDSPLTFKKTVLTFLARPLSCLGHY